MSIHKNIQTADMETDIRTNIMETKGLCYNYEDGKNALQDVSVAVRKGGVTAFLGGNGAGKSTLFLNLNGVLTPKSGEVFFNGRKVAFDAKGVKDMRKHVGIVFQDPNDQLFSASVRRDIAFGALNLGHNDEQAGRLVEEMAALTGVTALLDRPTHCLSYGQKKRVAIAGVLIMEPDVLIMDEPTAGLDPQGISEIFDLLMRVRADKGISIIIATHDIDIVPLYCDYAYVLHQGRLVMEGPPKTLFQRRGELRAYSLRTPRIAHLMEILSDIDCLEVDTTAATISQARATIKELLKE